MIFSYLYFAFNYLFIYLSLSRTDEQTYNEQKRKQVNIIIGMFGTLADLLNGIHWLPKGILWASKLPEEVVGLSGVISSLCLIYNSVTN